MGRPKGNSTRKSGASVEKDNKEKEQTKRGRKPKYTNDEDRLEARRLSNRQYRERQRAKLNEYNNLISKISKSE